MRRDASDGLEGKRRLERESAVKGWRGKGKENAKEKEAAFSLGWHGRGGLADGRGPPGVEETRTRRTTTEPHRDRQGLSLV